jgi:hypothetical protein
MMRAVLRLAKVTGLAALLAAGALLAVAITAGGRAATSADAAALQTTDTGGLDLTIRETTTVEQTVTQERTLTQEQTVTQERTTTVEHTTTRRVPVTVPTTGEESSSASNTPAWVWVLLGILVVGLIALIVMLARRGHGSGGAAPAAAGAGGVSAAAAESRRRLDAAVSSWTAQGWAVVSQSGDSAVLRRGGEQLMVSVDQAGHVTTSPLPGDTWPSR